jgi:hypothetical protein
LNARGKDVKREAVPSLLLMIAEVDDDDDDDDEEEEEEEEVLGWGIMRDGLIAFNNISDVCLLLVFLNNLMATIMVSYSFNNWIGDWPRSWNIEAIWELEGSARSRRKGWMNREFSLLRVVGEGDQKGRAYVMAAFVVALTNFNMTLISLSLLIKRLIR